MTRRYWMQYSHMWGIADRAPVPELRERRRARLERRRASGGSSKACDGCGHHEDRRIFRPKDDVCDNCLILMWDGEDARIEIERRQGDETETLKIPVGSRGRDTPAWPNWYVPHTNSYHSEAQALVNRGEIALADLIYLLLRPNVIEARSDFMTKGRMVPHDRMHNPPTYTVIAPKGTGDLIIEIDTAFELAIKAIFAEGQGRGRSLLTQLAAGEITINDLNEGKERSR